MSGHVGLLPSKPEEVQDAAKHPNCTEAPTAAKNCLTPDVRGNSEKP